jgi:hypothetical protein
VVRTRRTLIDYLWASPGSVVGVALGLVALLAGARWSAHRGVIEVALRREDQRRGVMPIVAITFGHVVLGRTAADLERLRAHEHAHVAQYERWGPLFFLAYPCASLLALLRTGRPYHDNCFEVEARAAARRSREAPPGGGLAPGSRRYSGPSRPSARD